MSRNWKVGVVGAGNMGSGIAQKMAQEGLDVVLLDREQQFVERGLQVIGNMLKEGVKRRIFTQDQVESITSRITGTTDYAALEDAHLVVEAVFEDQAVKSSVFQKLDAACSPRTILATNTSSFFVRDLANSTERPDRFIGLHYFFHPAKNRLLEVIPHEGTSPGTVETAMLLAALHGKTPILVKDSPGFAVNRFFVPFLNEAARMLEDGLANIPTIEEASRKAFRIGMGPFQLMNITGIPIAVHASSTLGRELGPFYATAGILRKQMETGQLWNLEGPLDQGAMAAVRDRMLGVCLGVAAQLVDEGVATMEDTDRGAKIGLRWLLGPFEIMNSIGINRTHHLVEQVAQRHEDFQVPQLLRRQKDLARPFSFDLVDLSTKDGIATITINRPEAMNALNETVVQQIEDRFLTATDDPRVRAILFRGAGKAFVAGADIRYFVKKIKSDAIADIVEFTRRGHQLFLAIEDSPKPTVALLDGMSLGGGSELALACQAVLTTAAGSMAFPETGIGIYPGLGGMNRLARMVGIDLARYYVFTGAPLNATDLLDLGIARLLDDISQLPSAMARLLADPLPPKYRRRPIPHRFRPLGAACSSENIQRLLEGQVPTGLDSEVDARTARLAGYKAPLALRMAHRIMEAASDKTMTQAVELELAGLQEIFSSADALEGLSSLGRRRPVFKGS